MKSVLWIGVVAVAAQLVPDSRANADAAMDSLVAGERAFAAMSAAKGYKEAFLTYLTEDAVLFRPTATNGRKLFEARPAATETLLWEPCFVAVSSAGDMGYTTGPWEMRPGVDSTGASPSAEKRSYGHFTSVWKKQKGGVWRVVADIGISHPKPLRGGLGSGELQVGPTLPIRTMKSSRVSLAGLDRNLSKAMRAVGTHEAIAAHGAPDLRVNIDGKYPAVGLEPSQAGIDSLAGFFDFTAEGSGIASSGDLGYSYGRAERFVSANAAAADTSVYFHVWRQDDGRTWKLALSVLNPLRKPGP